MCYTETVDTRFGNRLQQATTSLYNVPLTAQELAEKLTLRGPGLLLCDRAVEGKPACEGASTLCARREVCSLCSTCAADVAGQRVIRVAQLGLAPESAIKGT